MSRQKDPISFAILVVARLRLPYLLGFILEEFVVFVVAFAVVVVRHWRCGGDDCWVGNFLQQWRLRRRDSPFPASSDRQK